MTSQARKHSRDLSEEEWKQEKSMDKVIAAIARAAGAESPVHALHSPIVNNPPLLDTSEYIRHAVLGKGAIVIQGLREQAEEQRNLGKGTD